jgi:hypothetical protein
VRNGTEHEVSALEIADMTIAKEGNVMKLLPVTTVLALLLPALPAVAQQLQSDAPSAAECQEMFKAADINNDGILSRDELASSEDLREFYQADENVSSVPQSKFMSDCTG